MLTAAPSSSCTSAATEKRKRAGRFRWSSSRLVSFGTVAAKVCDIMPAARYGNSTLAILGSRDGRVFAIQVEKLHDYKHSLLFSSRQGYIYGEVSAVAIQDVEYRNLTVASNTGELLNFP